MSKRRMLKKEPEGMTKEKSQILEKVFKSLWQEGVTRNDIARQLNFPVDEIDQLTFNLAFIGTTINGTSQRKGSNKTQPNLQIIKS